MAQPQVSKMNRYVNGYLPSLGLNQGEYLSHDHPNYFLLLIPYFEKLRAIQSEFEENLRNHSQIKDLTVFWGHTPSPFIFFKWIKEN